MKVVTLDTYLRMKREAGIRTKAEAKQKKEKTEKLFNGLSFFAGIILYWIASFIITIGFFAVALMSL